MSVAAKKWVRTHSPAKGSSRTVLAELAWAGDASGRGARLSHRQLVAATGLSRATVQRALDVLERDDMIRRHRGCACAACERSSRGVVVFDVVMPEQIEDSIPGQMTLLAGAADQPHVRQVVRHVAEDDVPQGEAGSGLMVRHLEEKRRVKDSSSENTRELSNEPGDLLERVVDALTPTRLFVDRYALEGVVMRHAATHDIDGAVTAIVALASDPAYRLPKGGAAMMLLHELRRQTPGVTNLPARSSSRPAPVEPAELPDRYRQYDVAAGLAG